MKFFFTGETPRLPEPNPRRDRTAGVPNLPAHILDRHRARVLRPGDAPLAPGASTPGSTIYRYNRLMMCHKLLENDAQLSELDAALAVQGMRIDREHLAGKERSARMHRAKVTLGDRVTPAQVDAWTVMQTLRGAVDGGKCSQELISRLRLEHLLVGAAWTAVGDGHGSPSGGPYGGERLAELTYPGRTPVDLVLPLPQRRPVHALPGKRRPVIAVLDTGIAPHPELPVSDRQEDRDTFVTVDNALQEAISSDCDAEGPSIDGPWDNRFSDDSLLGRVAAYYGHGTFIAGIIRQLAPDAEVRSIRIMHNDGIAHENECLAALTALAEEAERARAGDETARPVDIVSLSWGYVDEDIPAEVPAHAHSALRALIERLNGLGIAVVAAAGNFASARPFYPAAFAAGPRSSEAAPTISVGALNPNGTVAMFSNDGPWLSAFATGAAMVSTYPFLVEGSEETEQNFRQGRKRESLDPDDFESGYALWSGTSFAGPVIAAKLAAAMLSESPVDMAAQDAQSVALRVQSALKAIGG
ncbi:S8 family peptidase [Stackebrandtia nassauensis]|uniref:Peptidase S8 and S53 subtilisin kexin sedolisin n=1 Tax=Stackebrandtia nassauensis (strain DSM 44728 / CIP 108903 / NRRL B-16338 / NBRC 102104 / LLR-40K-21) TaxID=446470 RepID=D3PWC9_STANL|nr:S8/S53 family peptidase [Stackebrandtia nassauensis]ADD41286.1 peptidase S8 and S53 subtilisin kexin sedolisin [Stackebrandtia nassauensis DSM 44728]